MHTVIPEIFALHVLIFVHFIFNLFYYLRFQEAVNIRCNKNSLKFNFRVFNFRGFFQPQIINNCENFQNYGIFKIHCTIDLRFFAGKIFGWLNFAWLYFRRHDHSTI